MDHEPAEAGKPAQRSWLLAGVRSEVRELRLLLGVGLGQVVGKGKSGKGKS